MKRFLITAVAVCAMATMILTPATVFGTVIVDDSWADAGRDNGADALDTDWWYSTSTDGIEVGTNFLGLVSGTSGRGIHGTFASQALGVGDILTATFTFTTPATVGTSKSTAFRAGFFDTTGHDLAQDLVASSTSPNTNYNNLSGYMMDWDVNTYEENISFRERSNAASGQLMASTGDYTSISGGGDVYSFAADTTYTGVLSLTRTGANALDLTGTLFQGATELSTWTATDTNLIASTFTFGMVAFHVNSSTFGSSNLPNTDNNGADFSNIKIEYTAIPEPSSAVLLVGGLLVLGRFLVRRSR